MKARIFSFAVLASVALLASCGQVTTESSEPQETVEMMNVEDMKQPTTIAVSIEGMSCPAGCAGPIQENCSKLAGVGKSEVNFDAKTGYFTFDASMLSQQDILKCIESTNGGGIYKAAVLEDAAPATEEAGDEVEALRMVKHEDEAHS